MPTTIISWIASPWVRINMKDTKDWRKWIREQQRHRVWWAGSQECRCGSGIASNNCLRQLDRKSENGKEYAFKLELSIGHMESNRVSHRRSAILYHITLLKSQVELMIDLHSSQTARLWKSGVRKDRPGRLPVVQHDRFGGCSALHQGSLYAVILATSTRPSIF